MEQSERIKEEDYAPKKLAPQKLDFTAALNVSPLQQVQSRPQQVPNLQTRATPLGPQMPAPPTPYQQRQQQGPVVHRIPHPVHKLSTMPHPKQDSPGSRQANEGTPKKPKQCNCKNSRCLKLYCECFAAGIHCNGCNCLNCQNNVENEVARKEAVEATLERNPNAFRPKIASSPHGSRDAMEDAKEMVGKHNKGCNCKRTLCLKKYCECFQANIFCSENCKCLECKNFEGSDELRALFRGSPNGMAYAQQATNAAICGAIGSSSYGTTLASRKRKGEELFGLASKDQPAHSIAKPSQGNNLRNSAASSSPLSIPVSHTSNVAVLGSSRVYKSPLADILQPQDIKDICAFLVTLSEKATKTLAGKIVQKDTQCERDSVQTYSGSSMQEREIGLKGCNAQKTLPDGCLNGNKVEKNGSTDSGENGGDMENPRPPSPEIDLMCHEEEIMFMEVRSPTGLPGLCQSKTQKPSGGYECSEIHAEQEKLMLTTILDILNRVSTCGSIKVSQSGNQEEPAERTTVKAGIEMVNQQKGCANGVVQTPAVSTFVSRSDVPIKSASPIQREPPERGTIKSGIQLGNHKGYRNSFKESPVVDLVATLASNSDLPMEAASLGQPEPAEGGSKKSRIEMVNHNGYGNGPVKSPVFSTSACNHDLPIKASAISPVEN